MAIYETLAKAYDELFPPAPEAAAFIGRAIGSSEQKNEVDDRPWRNGAGRAGAAAPTRGKPAIDLGCATGAHVALLAGLGYEALGVDPSEAMLAEAARRHGYLSATGRASFRSGGMLDVDALVEPGGAALVLCVGNTLPHLARSELSSFLGKAARALEPGGRLVVQLLNYGRLLAERPERLPDIRAGGWLFRRSYRYRADGLVEFDTELSRLDGAGVPSGNPSGADRGSTTLTPFAVDELLEAASEAGLEARGAYSSWARQPFEPSSSMVALLELVRT